MKEIEQKLKNSSGETLAEALVAALIAGVALLMLASMIMVSHRMMNSSDETVRNFYEDVNQVEMQSGESETGRVTITGSGSMESEVDVNIYKSDDGKLVSYAK